MKITSADRVKRNITNNNTNQMLFLNKNCTHRENIKIYIFKIQDNLCLVIIAKLKSYKCIICCKLIKKRFGNQRNLKCKGRFRHIYVIVCIYMPYVMSFS